MTNVLYISMALPYEKVMHAGGKTFYYYIKALQDDENYCVSLISKVLSGEEFDKENLSRVSFFPVKNQKMTLWHPLVAIKDINSKVNPFCYYGNTLRQSIYDQIMMKLKELKNKPDIIVLEFTEMVLLAPKIRKLFPDVRLLASEHDVSYLGCERKVLNENNLLKRILKTIKYRIRKRNELKALALCDSVMPHNFKDKSLLIKDGVSERKIYVLTPFFQKVNCSRKPDYKTILFYGAMGRSANVDAAIWFIENVLPKIDNKDVKFIILGSNPQKKLLKYKSENVIITGFVEDIFPYFESCMCMVVPLRDGAGIKVKVLEALSAGIPVLTNEIGIEGIKATDGIEYIYCNKSEDFVSTIQRMINGEIDLVAMCDNEKRLMNKEYDLKKAIDTYKNNLGGSNYDKNK